MEITVQDSHTAQRTIELWVRSFAPTATGPTRERALEQVVRLEATGTVESVSVDGWGAEIELETLSERVPQIRKIERRLTAFEEWAGRTDRDLEPFFRRRQVESTITGERHDVYRLPTIALAEFDERGLVHVAPCRDGDRTIDVFDRFDTLRADSRRDRLVRFDGDPDDRRDDSISRRVRSRPTEPDPHVEPHSPGPY
ncbi:hypothetical protein AArcMg_2870 [Natrarchaeobaculum sulfurireducens]|uniref:Uncharacterized protein n=1 Tax=Natrarchaeobaculum sulfurireducens TaxID=2044521 RepID=A0A346PTL4_9EURY|nr:hypothetical protein AArcMg_2870 [Natrarchaeobaculum sulfurireducens]